MAQKYTILKAITRTSNKGFTLLELLVGMIITLIIGGLAMQAFINASATFSKDKKSIDSNQNLSAILQIIGDDIKQSGEQINDTSFPTIEFAQATAASDPTLKLGSSKVIIRRALSDPLTLCEKLSNSPTAASAVSPIVTIGVIPAAAFQLLVADNNPATVNISSNCNVGTDTSQLLGSRPSTSYTLPPTTALPAAGSILNPLLPNALRKARDYRCKLDNPNPTVSYDDATRANEDFCDSLVAPFPKVRVAVSDNNGHILILNQSDEIPVAGNTADSATGTIIKKYGITVDTIGLDSTTVTNNLKNKAVDYNIGSPVYLIEERVYTLNSDGNLQVSVDGAPPSTLIKRIEKFTVSAKGYTNLTDRLINPTPTANVCADAPLAAVATSQNPQYICKFNYNSAVGDPAMNWKMIAGVKIELQAKYDGTGQNATATVADEAKLTATAEFFPRNVLSR